MASWDAAAAFGRLARLVTRRPLATVAVVGALSLIGAVLAFGLEPSASTDTLVGSSSPSVKATNALHRQFGDEPVVIDIQGDLQRTVLTDDLARLIRLEGCLSGNIPAQALAAYPRVCSRIAAAHPAKVVYGPGTFINTAANEIQDGFQQQEQAAIAGCTQAGQAAQQAAAAKGESRAQQDQAAQLPCQVAQSQFTQQMLQLAVQYGLTSVPSVNDPQFVYSLVFDTAGGTAQPKPRFAFLFPSDRAALIQVRMKPNLTDAQRRQALVLFRETLRDPAFRLRNGQRYYLSGVPVVVDGLAGAVQSSIFVLFAAALVIMAVTLAAVFKTRRRLKLLPLGVAVAAAAITYGCVSLAGLSLTMASIAALPVMIGLAVDYAIQLQARFDEARARGDGPAVAARSAARAGAPTIAGAALATAAGFLVLLLSPVPMVHGFVFVVILGIALAFACALTAGLAVMSRFSISKPRPADLPPLLPRARMRLANARDGLLQLGSPFTTAPRVGALVGACVLWVGIGVAATALWLRLAMLAALVATLTLIWGARAGRAELGSWLSRRLRRALTLAVDQPQRVLAIAFTIALIGWVVDTQTGLVSDVRQLVPRNLPALRDANRLERATGVSGEIDVVVRGADLTNPAVIKWMTDFQQRLLQRHGFRAGSRCNQTHNAPELCPALSLTDLFRQPPTQAAQVQALLAAVPPYFSQAVITPDRRTATLAFGIRLMPLDRQQQVVDDIARHLNPPAGVTAQVAGLPVLAAQANGQLSSESRRLLSLAAGLAAVFLVLLAIRRRVEDALVPLIPIALATGWSALVLFLLRIPLNPMSVTLGTLVIAIATEFSVLLSARYREERDAGAGPERALELSYRSTGAAVLASGVTATAGFAALMASDIRMLRDFGAVTVVDLAVSLVGVAIVLPAALVWAERRGALRLRDLDPRRLWQAYWGALRPQPVQPLVGVTPVPAAPRGGWLRSPRAVGRLRLPLAGRRALWRRSRRA
jgi:uncharacterized protein